MRATKILEAKPEPEKCVWTSASKPMVPQAYKTSCGTYRFLDIFFTGFCPDCGKRIEVKEGSNGRE